MWSESNLHSRKRYCQYQNVLKILHQLEVKWPAWTPWDDPKLNPDTCKNTAPSTETAKLMRSYHTNGTYGCGDYASIIGSRIFGGQTNPCRQMEDLTQIRPGDVFFRVNNATVRLWHVIVALESPNGLHSYHVTGGSHDGIVFWTDQESQYGGENPDCDGEDKNHRWKSGPATLRASLNTGNSVETWSTAITEAAEPD